jgi:hypothetical protein
MTKRVTKNARKRGFSVMQKTAGGRIVKKHTSFSEAQKLTGVNSGSISKATRGIIKTAGGFRWELSK